MASDNTGKKNITWRKGFHRIFILLSSVWTVYVLVGFPIQQVNQRSEFAASSYGFNLSYPPKDEKEKEERERNQKALWAEANLAHIYKTEIFPNFHWVLLAIFFPPAILYGLIRAVISLSRWLFRGFAP